MIRRLPLWPSLAAGLGLVLLAEWFGGGRPPAPKILPVQTAGATSPVAAQNWSQTILARPLFNPGRRPAGGAATPDGLPRLSAIIIGQGQASAIFADAAKPLVVQAGGTVDGALVQRIDPEGVVLLTPSGPMRLRPRFATPAGTPTPPPADTGPDSSQPVTSSTTAGPYDNE